MINLSNLHEATEQEVFDQAAYHLLTQNRKSLNEDGGCAYRGLGGDACSGGCFIASDEYLTEMEGIAWDDLKDRCVVPECHGKLIADLQYIHDKNGVFNWIFMLEELACDYELNAKVLDVFRQVEERMEEDG